MNYKLHILWYLFTVDVDAIFHYVTQQLSSLLIQGLGDIGKSTVRPTIVLLCSILLKYCD